ncbi:hypothetical protein MGG_16540 [Pyricularia oryzae 70-15]|uniref:Uncharacterized protein n=1 Tax=Pyricularia oryzae (strain 70-15 / ATCC MYA-4617 / FGSC 8958) TaxID=242507 RepID=G4MKZ6_PYRO7|nr:uncharacterized protein MGG_16540 [Pyricularia oryzae 70-15]EHA58423.1 hypothetical protein MGG_16540 [Pyricularia oryzae 70-15]
MAAEDFVHVLEQKQKRGFAPWRLHQMFCVQILKFWHLCSLGTGAEKVESAFQLKVHQLPPLLPWGERSYIQD